MPIVEQLYLRALRILNDGLVHSAAALRWARETAGCMLDEDTLQEPESGFSLRELSLGAAK
jgi:hypothetical protein